MPFMGFKNYEKLEEEPLKGAVREDWFNAYKCTQIGKIDFVVAEHESEVEYDRPLFEQDEETVRSILWAEAKKGTKADIHESFVQLILTVGKARTFEKHQPPKYVGAFDAEKIAFIEWHKIQEVFYMNDFNWNVAPSDHETKEFKKLYALCESSLEENSIMFSYASDEKDLKAFIQKNFKTGHLATAKIAISKNNFIFVFQKWLAEVMPTISADWKGFYESYKITVADFFLADLISSDGESIKDTLKVVLNKNKYTIQKIKVENAPSELFSDIKFNDSQQKYKIFWSRYERPPKEEYWDFIIGRKDLLVPQDIRERKGSYFTPQKWVEKSQQYLADVLGENWQSEYYVWDCCAGTGNLLNGLTNYRNVWASTLDDSDVEIMKDRINNGWPMFENHVFQFDFLNDGFDKCPEDLRAILNDEEKRKKLVVYINPPYAEATTARTVTGTGSNKSGVATENKTYKRFKDIIGKASNEIFAQFLIRVSVDLQCCKLGQFAKLKALCASNFAQFRGAFKAKLAKAFIVPAKTFDNVTGEFPIGFFVWNTGGDKPMSNDNNFAFDVYNANGSFLGVKKIHSESAKPTSINRWMKKLDTASENIIGYMENPTPDFQNNKFLCIINHKGTRHNNYSAINDNTIVVNAIYFAVRHCIEATWLNDRDQFLWPDNGWQTDFGFQADCLFYTLFHGQNRISCEQGENHWIPFTESQVGCKKAFKSDFMSRFLANFLNGKITVGSGGDMFSDGSGQTASRSLSQEAQAVFGAGLELWKYYHSQENTNPDAAFYDIRKRFQGLNPKTGRMNNDSNDERYTELIGSLREKMKALAKRIEPKVYRYGFLK